jgi:hypothetical protein
MVVFVANEDTLAGTAHTVELIMLFQALQASWHGGIFLGLSLLGTKSVVAQRVQPNCLGLLCREIHGDDWTARIGSSQYGLCFLEYPIEKLSTYGWLLWIAVAVVVAILSVRNRNRDEVHGVHEERRGENEEEGREEEQKDRSFADGDASRYRYRRDRLPECDLWTKQRRPLQAIGKAVSCRGGRGQKRKGE